MSWFRRRKPAPIANPHATEIHTARRELRTIEWYLKNLDARRDVERVRTLTARHQVWREQLARYGVNRPAPIIHW